MKTKNSKELFKKSKEHIAGGVNSPVRAFKSVGGTPIFLKNPEVAIFMMKMATSI